MHSKISSRAQRIRITVDPGGQVTVTRPPWVSQFIADRFVAIKSKWIGRAVSRMKKIKPRLALPRSQYRARRKQAERFVHSRVAQLNKHYNFKFRSITVRNQSSRWGSCSRQGNLSFNYKIIFLPQHLADYLIVHELCHLAQLNHSKKFWSLVAQTIPNPKQARKELRRYDLRLA